MFDIVETKLTVVPKIAASENQTVSDTISTKLEPYLVSLAEQRTVFFAKIAAKTLKDDKVSEDYIEIVFKFSNFLNEIKPQLELLSDFNQETIRRHVIDGIIKTEELYFEISALIFFGSLPPLS